MPSLATISLAAPAMLWALSALAAPIIIHLIARRVRRVISFPAVRLMAQALTHQRRSASPRRWILLLIRCIAVAALVTAFAQPSWHDPRFVAPIANDRSRPHDLLIIVLDNSASMGRLLHGGAIFNSARARAAALLDSIDPAQTSTAIIVTSPVPTALLPEPTANLAALRQALDKVRVEPTPADSVGSITLASRLAQVDSTGNAPYRTRQAVIITDLQATDWSMLTADSAKPCFKGIDRLTMIPIAGPSDNVALSFPAASTGAAAQRPVAIAVTVTNHGRTPVESHVRTAVDGRFIGNCTVALPVGASRQASFVYTPDSPGLRQVTFAIDDDALIADNTQVLALNIADRLRVVLVSGSSPDRPDQSAFILARALAPDPSAVDLTWQPPSSIHSRVIDAANVIVISDDAAAGLTRENARLVARRVVAGATLMIFLAPDMPSESLDELDAALSASSSGGLPWSLRETKPHRGKTELIAAGDWTWAPLRDFDANARRALAGIAHRPSFNAAPLRAGAHHAIQFADGTSAVSYRSGHSGGGGGGGSSGRIVLCNFRPTPDAGDLPRHGLFVALLQALSVPGMADTIAASIFPGQSIRWHVPSSDMPAAFAVRVIAPDGQPIDARAEDGAADGVVTVVARQLGFYRVMSNDRLIHQMAVNLDTTESNLRTMSENELQQLQAALPNMASVTADALPNTIAANSNQPRALWPWCLEIVALSFALESLLVVSARSRP